MRFDKFSIIIVNDDLTKRRDTDFVYKCEIPDEDIKDALMAENERLREEKKELIAIAKDYHSYSNRIIKDWEWARLNRILERLTALEEGKCGSS